MTSLIYVCFLRNCATTQQDMPHLGTRVQALITHDNFAMRDTIVQENGKVVTEGDDISEIFQLPLDYYDIKTNRPLRLKKKLYEFYTAPITKFWGHSIAYVLFLMVFSYVVLVKMAPNPSWEELYVIAYISTLACEKIREIVSSEPVAISHKFSVWAWNMWNPCDAAAIIFFLIGLCLRLRTSSMKIGRIVFCVDIIYWYVRILNILGVNKYLGPLVTMMGKMVKNMIYIVLLLLVVLMSFGVCRQSIRHQDEEPSWGLIRNIFLQPYFMLYGEVYAGEIDPPCGDEPGMAKCQVGDWITPVVMSTYLLVANILLINLLIAVFNNIFNEVNAVSHQVWMFQRFTVVMEYEEKPMLPPPLILLCHIYLLLKYCRRKVGGVRELYDNALKLFLDSDDLERLYDFEEECVEGYFREKETKLHLSSDERIKNTAERVENMCQKVEDINLKESSQTTSIQSVEFRMRKLEDVSEQTLSHLAVIHRFMATHVRDPISSADLAEVRLAGERLRKSSERSDDTKALAEASDTHDKLLLLPPGFGNHLNRRRPTRSLTEVRPDSFFLGEGLHMRLDEDSRSLDPVKDKCGSLLEEVEESVETEKEFPIPSTKVLARQFSRQKSFSGNSLVEPSSSRTNSKDDGTDVVDSDVDHLQGTDVFPVDVFRSGSLDSRSERRGSDPHRKQSSDMGGGEGSDASSLYHRPPLLTRRQLSKTHSEPENPTAADSMDSNDYHRVPLVERSVTWAEPRITVIRPSSKPRSRLLTMHTEYTSITDELESVCGLLSPPCTPRLLSPPRPGEAPQPRRMRHASEMSNPEMALFLEKEHLRDAEESDYHMMERLIQRRLDEEDETPDNAFFLTVTNETPEFRNPSRALRRSSAIEVKDLPATSVPEILCTDTDTQQLQLIKSDSKNSLVPTSETMC